MDDRLMYRREFFIGGAWAAPAGHDRFGVVSPSTEEVVGEVPLATTADIDRAVGAARSAFDDGPWPRMAPGDRADVLARAATILRKREAEIAGVTVDEMGCAISQAPRAQTGMVAALFDHYAELIRTFEFERQVVAGDRAGLVTNEPVGVWTGDPARGLRVARRMRTGSIAINGTYPPFPLVPFGGFKESGLGRELGPEGLQSFLEPRSIGLPAALRPGR